MPVVSSPLVPATSSPASEQDLWAMPHMLREDWSGGVRVVESYQTTIAAAESAAEQRLGLTDRPTRVIRLPQVSFRREEALALQMMMVRRAQAGSLTPLLPDTTILESAVSPGGTVLTCDTTLRRLHVGARVVIWQTRATIVVEAFEVATIDSLTDTTLTLTAGLSSSYGVGARVTPLIESQIGLSHRGRITTDWHTAASIEAVEEIGPMSLPGLTTLGTLPPDYQTHNGLPIFTGPINYGEEPEFSFERQAVQTEVGLGSLVRAYGDRGAFGFSLPLTFLTRADAWRFKHFFDSRGGRLHPFWFPSPVAEYVPEAITTTTIQIKAIGTEEEWQFRPYVSLRLRDGTIHIRGVQSVVRASGSDTITLDASIPTVSLDNILRLGVARLCRFSSDELVEQWTTTSHMGATVSVLELVREANVNISDLAKVTTVGLAAAFSVGGCPGEQPSNGGPCSCPPELPSSVIITELAYLTNTVWTSTGQTESITEHQTEDCWYIGQYNVFPPGQIIDAQLQLLEDSCTWQIFYNVPESIIMAIYTKEGPSPFGTYTLSGTEPDGETAPNIIEVSEP